MIVGIGTDLVEVKRIGKLIERWRGSFLQRVYTAAEITYCEQKKIPAVHFAARFAAKESFLKSMGMGIGMGLNLRDIEVGFNGQGTPELHLRGKARDILDDRVGAAIHLSMTHTEGHASAIVVIET